MDIGKRLKEARKTRRMTRSQLDEKIGVQKGVIADIECSVLVKTQYNPAVINAICVALDINKEWLVDGVGPMENKANSEKVLAEINELARKLSERERILVLDVIKIFSNYS